MTKSVLVADLQGLSASSSESSASTDDPLSTLRPQSVKDLFRTVDCMPAASKSMVSKILAYSELNIQCVEQCKERIDARCSWELTNFPLVNNEHAAAVKFRFDSMKSQCTIACGRKLLSHLDF